MNLNNFAKYTITAAVAIFAVTVYLTSGHPSDADVNNATVKVVRNDQRSGGTGVILYSNEFESAVLTNDHVCGVVKSGGLVVTTSGDKYEVKTYKESLTHDLCLITVGANLHASTTLASKAPSMFDAATISGHPQLLPNIVTKGHFSGKEQIEVAIGVRKCEPADIANPATAAWCLFLGSLPVIKRYESQVVSATIQPGSSGSAVYNDKNELSGLVFAGSGQLAYAFIVPYEFVAYFLNVEARTLEEKQPDQLIDVGSLIQQHTTETDENTLKIKNLCLTPHTKEQEQMCEIVNRSML